MLDATLAVIHHIAVFSLFGTLESLAFIGRVDLFYGISAGVLLIIGLVRVNFGAKGWAFYSASPLFWIKLGTFVLIGLISIYPTVRFIQGRKTGVLPSLEAQRSVVKAVSAQLHLILLMPVLAVLMARGFGFRG
jgi:putative membrane protein